MAVLSGWAVSRKQDASKRALAKQRLAMDAEDAAVRTPLYRATSLTGNSAPLGPYSRTMPRALWQSCRVGQFPESRTRASGRSRSSASPWTPRTPRCESRTPEPALLKNG